MSIQDTSAKFSHDKELNNFKVNIDSHYDFLKNDFRLWALFKNFEYKLN